MRTPSLAALLVGFVALSHTLMLAGCARTADRAADEQATYTTYVLVTLKSGPTSGQGAKDERQRMFAGHMANIQRLADEKKLLMAGPFASPRDKAWRGLFLLDTASLADARAWCGTDPGVIAGEFSLDLKVMRGCPSIRTTLALEEAANAKRTPDPSKPMQGMRRYAIATCDEDAHLAAGHAAAARAGIRVVWCGRFDGVGATRADHGGVLVLDAEDVEKTRAALGECGCGVDGWFSTESLMDLPGSAGRMSSGASLTRTAGTHAASQ